MTLERWGSLSVTDHIDVQALTANVLLYDRLIVPVLEGQPDRDERAYWLTHGWQPDLQQQRLEQLGELAVKRPWDRHRRKLFTTRFAQLDAEKADAAAALQMTRRILAQEPVVHPPGVHGVEVVAAYSSLAGLRQDFDVRSAEDNQAAQALLITRRLMVPMEPDPEDSLKAAVELSKKPEFRACRNELFEWQASPRIQRLDPAAAVSHLVDLVGAYNQQVEAACSNRDLKFAFTILGAGLGFLTGGPVGAAAGAALSLIQFATLDRKPVVDAADLRPFAMFHDMEVKLGLQLR